MITNTEIRRAGHKASPVFGNIQSIYLKLPETTCACETPGACCAFLPEMTLMEALQWIRVMQQMAEPVQLALVKKFVEFYLTNPLRRMGCPFLSGGHCGIYEFRTFACRAYGLWSKKMGQERTRESRAGKRQLLKLWQHQGIEMESETIADEMDYCLQVACRGGKKISDGRLMTVLQELYALDSKLSDLQTKFENEYYSDFSFLMTSLTFSFRKAVLGKLAVIKELSQSGTDMRLQKLLSQIKPAHIQSLFGSN